MTRERYDVVVVGGGVVGMATALALLACKPRKLLVLEAEPELAAHQTGRNSGVIHSGIYYKPGSLKATLCVRGKQQMLDFCREQGVPVDICGKVIVATNDDERPALETLVKRAEENGVRVVRLTPEQLREREPHVLGVASVLVPDTGIVNYGEVNRAMSRLVIERGADVRLAARVTAVTAGPSEFSLETASGTVLARNIVNCAGLQSDRVARMCGAKPGVAIIPFRGEYYDLAPRSRGLCKHLIYPVPDARYPFLGVHYTRMMSGGVEAGPNAVLALKREGYTRTSFSLRDTAELLAYEGFWKMARQHWRTGMGELARSMQKSRFVRSLQALIPEITEGDLEPGRAGVRAQAVDHEGRLIDDFRLVEGHAMLHVLNAPSPAATASLAIGEHLAQTAERCFRDA
jgi:L-2-hydroxyglutarate oxidase